MCEEGQGKHPALKELRAEQEAAALRTKWSGRSAESTLWVGRQRPHSFRKEKEVGRRKGKAKELLRRWNEVTATLRCQVPDSLAVKPLQVPDRQHSD